MGCSSKQAVEPTQIVLSYGESSITAVIQQNNMFDAIEDNENETVEFSGSLTKQDSGYLMDIVVVQEKKIRQATMELNTTLLIQVEEPIVVGGYNNDVWRVILKK